MNLNLNPTNREIHLAIQNFREQQQIFQSKAKYKVVPKGRRFGLTKGAANDFIESALNREFSKGLWGDVINANIDRYIERYFMPHLKKLPKNLWEWKKQDKIVFIKDAYIDFRSADNPENWEGFGYDKSFLNEAGIILKNEYLWDHAIRPMYWDYPYGNHVIGGTPKGRGKFWELYQRAKDPAQSKYAGFTFSSFDNPYLDHAALKEEMKDMPERVIRQEIYAEFLEDTGVVFRNAQLVMVATPKPPVQNHMYVIGADLAKVQDWTVITVYDREDNTQVYQDRFKTLGWPFIKGRIKAVADHYNKALVVLDATGVGDPIADDLLRAGVAVEPFKFTNESKKQLVEKLSNYIELKRIKMLPLEETKREFENFTYDISATGKILYEAPVGFNDDIVMSHALAVWALQPLAREEDAKDPTPTQLALARAKQKYDEQYNNDSGDGFDQWETPTEDIY